MVLSWAERCSVSSRWCSAELMDALSKAPDKKPAAAAPKHPGITHTKALQYEKKR